MTFEACRQALVPETSAPGDQITAGTLDLFVSPDLGVAVDPRTSVLKWVWEKSPVFSLFSLFLSGKTGATTSKLLHAREEPETLGHQLAV